MSTDCCFGETGAEDWVIPAAVAAGFGEVYSFSFGVMSARAAAKALFRDFRGFPTHVGRLVPACEGSEDQVGFIQEEIGP